MSVRTFKNVILQRLHPEVIGGWNCSGWNFR